MRKCKECGAPHSVARYIEWTPDGTILGRDEARTRIVIVEVKEIRNIFSGISGRIGFNIDRIIHRAEKEVGWRLWETLVPSFVPRIPRNRLFRPQWAGRLLVNLMADYAAPAGMGDVRVEEYSPGRSARYRIFNPHSIPLYTGSSAGTFEFLENADSESEWKEVGEGEVLVDVRKTGEAPAADERLVFDKPSYIPGNVRYERCPRCGVPRALLDNLDHDLKRHLVYNRVSGQREVAMIAHSFSAVFRELERELGSEIPLMVQAFERAYMRETSGEREYLNAGGETGDILKNLTWRGIGNPVGVESTPSGEMITIENPFHAGMVAGRVAGLYEFLKQTEVSVTWSEEVPGRLKITLR